MIPWILDTETARFSPGNMAPAIACMSVCSGSGAWLFDSTNYIKPLTDLLADPNVLIVGHAIDYDMAVFCANAPHLIPLIFAAYRANRITCTMIREQLIDIAEDRFEGFDRSSGKPEKITYELENLARRHCGIFLDKETYRQGYGELIGIPIERWSPGARKYPIDDVRATETLFYWQETNGARWLEDQYRQTRSAFWLRLLSVWGIRTDKDAISDLEGRTQTAYELLATQLRSAGILRPNTSKRKRNGTIEYKRGSRDTEAAQARIIEAYAKLGKPCPMTDPTVANPNGQPALDEQACLDSGDPVLAAYAEFAGLSTIITKDLPMLRAGISQSIHPRFICLKETGRTGCKNPNIQNLRRLPGIRECFVPRCLTCQRVHTRADIERDRCLGCGDELTVYISSDFGGLELSTQAQACIDLVGYSILAQAINADIDPHLLIAESLVSRPYDEIKKIKKAGAMSDCVAGKGRTVCTCAWCIVDNARQIGKVANFGFPGGLGAATLVFFALASYGVRITEDLAHKLKHIWISRFPEWREYFRYIDRTIKRREPLEQIRSRRFRGNKGYTNRCNSIFQGYGADIAKDAGFRITEEMYVPSTSPLFGARMVDFVHDDFILECKQSRSHDAAMRLGEIMKQTGRDWLPGVKLDSSPIVARRMSKKAKQVWRDGRLIPWGDE